MNILKKLLAYSFIMWINLIIPITIIKAGGLEPAIQPESLSTETSFTTMLTEVINWFLGIVGAIALLMLVIGGFRYLISGGNQEAVDKAKNTITYSIIGIIVIILSFAIVSTVVSWGD